MFLGEDIKRVQSPFGDKLRMEAAIRRSNDQVCKSFWVMVVAFAVVSLCFTAWAIWLVRSMI